MCSESPSSGKAGAAAAAAAATGREAPPPPLLPAGPPMPECGDGRARGPRELGRACCLEEAAAGGTSERLVRLSLPTPRALIMSATGGREARTLMSKLPSAGSGVSSAGACGWLTTLKSVGKSPSGLPITEGPPSLRGVGRFGGVECRTSAMPALRDKTRCTRPPSSSASPPGAPLPPGCPLPAPAVLLCRAPTCEWECCSSGAFGVMLLREAGALVFSCDIAMRCILPSAASSSCTCTLCFSSATRLSSFAARNSSRRLAFSASSSATFASSSATRFRSAATSRAVSSSASRATATCPLSAAAARACSAAACVSSTATHPRSSSASSSADFCSSSACSTRRCSSSDAAEAAAAAATASLLSLTSDAAR
eukprot:Rhum_TRINITY_DN6226_c0_g2::Rhum_TRINITY_DN6226_c0_g2_i1::g.19453::m.19453